MNPDLVKGFAWLLLSLAPFILVQRILHREIQIIFYALTKSQEFSLGLFSLLFFPGVLLHELSHYLFARLVGVQTGRLSLLPKRVPGNKIVMGYVETAHADIFRTSLIGAAPLITGCLVVAWIGNSRLILHPLIETFLSGNYPIFTETLAAVPQQPDFWVWFYLIFVISSTMLPSESDRSAFLPLLATFTVLLAIILVVGLGQTILNTFSTVLLQSIQALAFIFTISLMVHIVLFFPLRLIRGLLLRIRNLQIQSEG